MKNKTQDEGCEYKESDTGECTHPSKNRGTAGTDGKRYYGASDAAKANLKKIVSKKEM